MYASKTNYLAEYKVFLYSDVVVSIFDLKNCCLRVSNLQRRTAFV